MAQFLCMWSWSRDESESDHISFVGKVGEQFSQIRHGVVLKPLLTSIYLLEQSANESPSPVPKKHEVIFSMFPQIQTTVFRRNSCPVCCPRSASSSDHFTLPQITFSKNVSSSNSSNVPRQKIKQQKWSVAQQNIMQCNVIRDSQCMISWYDNPHTPTFGISFLAMLFHSFLRITDTLELFALLFFWFKQWEASESVSVHESDCSEAIVVSSAFLASSNKSELFFKDFNLRLFFEPKNSKIWLLKMHERNSMTKTLDIKKQTNLNVAETPVLRLQHNLIPGTQNHIWSFLYFSECQNLFQSTFASSYSILQH